MPSPNLNPLTVHTTSHLSNPFSMIGRLNLPVAIQKSVYATAAGDNLYLWINGPDGGETNLLRITDDKTIEQLPKLDFMIGGAAYCQNQFVVTGIDDEKKPVVLGVDRDANEVWRYQIEGPMPTVWQRPYCIGNTYLIWQTSPHDLHVAQAHEDGLHHHQSINMSVPPTNFASDGQAIYALGASDDGLNGIKISDADIQPIHITMPYPSNLTIGTVDKKLHIAWTQNKTAYIAQVLGNSVNILWELDLGQASAGKTTLVTGDTPLLWSQYSDYDGNNINQWLSMIFHPERDALQITGLIQNITWWGKTLVVTGSVDILLFE